MDISLKLVSGNKTMYIGSQENLRLLDIKGIEAGDIDLATTSNVLGDGSYINNSRINYRDIELEVKHVGFDNENMRQKIISFFNPHKKAKLYVTIGDTTKTIEYKPEKLVFGHENINHPIKFFVSLYCPDPYFKNAIDTKQEIAVWKGLFHFNLNIPPKGIEMGYREPSLIVDIYNNGDVDTGLIIKFKAQGVLENPSLFNIDTREYIKIDKSMKSGDIIEVNTNIFNKKVELTRNNEKSNIFHFIDLNSTFLQLKEGSNLFRYDADSGLDNLEVDVYYNTNSLGI